MFFNIMSSLIDLLCDGKMFGVIMNIQLHRWGLIQTHCNEFYFNFGLVNKTVTVINFH
jgi:hypothetical protein